MTGCDIGGCPNVATRGLAIRRMEDCECGLDSRGNAVGCDTCGGGGRVPVELPAEIRPICSAVGCERLGRQTAAGFDVRVVALGVDS